MKLYTKQGDDGLTALFGGDRVSKDDPRVVAYGEVDATNAAIGLAVAAARDETVSGPLRRIQADLFTLGAQLAAGDGKRPQVALDQARVTQLEHWIDEASAACEPLKHFILPGGCDLAARLHLARTACRRAERQAVALARSQTVSREVLVYLNRLSDLLFSLARLANHRAGVEDVEWIAPRGGSADAHAS